MQNSPFGITNMVENAEAAAQFPTILGMAAKGDFSFMGNADMRASAYGPFSIDAEDESDFQHRWLTLFARAATGELNRPSRMPVPPGFFAE
jgi:hypothetical protein